MEAIKHLVNLFLHLDKSLGDVIREYGTWTYGILFLILFAETGLVVTPFLPGDSLLFITGYFASRGDLSYAGIIALLLVAVFLGDNTNYWIGRLIGPKIFSNEKSRFFKREHLNRTHAFYEKYGGKAIIMARFVPIVRTFAPFVAGIGTMPYARFLSFSVFGAALWVVLCVTAGFFFGGLEVVKKHFDLLVLAIIAISLLPVVIEYLRHRSEQRARADKEAVVATSAADGK